MVVHGLLVFWATPGSNAAHSNPTDQASPAAAVFSSGRVHADVRRLLRFVDESLGPRPMHCAATNQMPYWADESGDVASLELWYLTL
jgi:hypothetical protein